MPCKWKKRSLKSLPTLIIQSEMLNTLGQARKLIMHKADQVSWNDLQFSKIAISAPKFNKFECLDSYFINTYRKSCYFPILFIARAKVFRFWFICRVRVWTMFNKLMINLLEEARRSRSEGGDPTEYVIGLLQCGNDAIMWHWQRARPVE